MNLLEAKIASEGFKSIILFLVLACVFSLFNLKLVSIIFLLLSFSLIFFFRDPERKIPDDQGTLVSPADGEVIVIENSMENNFLNRTMTKISISLSLFDCHINRFPVAGNVLKTRYIPGKFNIANFPGFLYSDRLKRSCDENEKLGMLIEDENKDNIVLYQIAGFLARRIISYAQAGSYFDKGQKFGMIKFGSRVDMYLPSEKYDLSVEVGDRVYGGESIIAWHRIKEN